MHTKALLDELVALETKLHQPSTRGDRQRLAALLHDDFREIGRSGLTYDRDQVLDALPREASPDAIHGDAFQLSLLADGLALLTYRSVRTDAQGITGSHTLRSSLWQRDTLGWRMRFHQGTPCAPFA
ncbi:MAG: hypothetical protein GAK28_01238 [Luteibacter sp.]|uniref:nuclear transport factor 2 family protein n=1 Tax=Luteibacter sp. TaxID=1886636 RepID=UPI0013836A59|nr:nuclear transport factor 2 family protein [Luteibacter sp.]KAF1008258.1 MAG: hypothetical protein GAK28_01238 [Luteibacter sp.]